MIWMWQKYDGKLSLMSITVIIENGGNVGVSKGGKISEICISLWLMCSMFGVFFLPAH